MGLENLLGLAASSPAEKFWSWAWKGQLLCWLHHRPSKWPHKSSFCLYRPRKWSNREPLRPWVPDTPKTYILVNGFHVTRGRINMSTFLDAHFVWWEPREIRKQCKYHVRVSRVKKKRILRKYRKILGEFLGGKYRWCNGKLTELCW